MEKEDNQNHLRLDGKIPIISVEAENLAEATHKAILACHDYGVRVETPKQRQRMSLGYDADITIRVRDADAEPKIYFPGMHDTAAGVMQYILEMTHGIHNHWKKSLEEPHFWGYTYNERFNNQIPFVLARIKHDWDKKGRITGRDYQFGTWRADEDVILEQEDPPCLQRGQFRFLQNEKGEWVLNYVTDWRSRDLLKAWNQNNIGQIELQKLFAAKVSDMLRIPIKIGAYVDRSSSLHLYGLYIDRDGLEKQIKHMRKEGYDSKSMSLEDYFATYDGLNKLWDRTSLKKLISAQSIAEYMGHGKQQPPNKLVELGFNLENWTYPKEWDSWPSSWDKEADPIILRR